MKFVLSSIAPITEKKERVNMVDKNVVGMIEFNNEYYFVRLNSKIRIPIANKSFKCEGFNIIYTRIFNNGTKATKIIRDNKNNTIRSYVPFKHGLLVKGDIIIEDGISKFLLKKNDIDGFTEKTR